MDQGLPHKTRYTETNRRKGGEEPGTQGHRGKFSEQNTNGLFSKIKNLQMGPHKIAVSVRQRTKGKQHIGKRSLSILHQLNSREPNNPIKNREQN